MSIRICNILTVEVDAETILSRIPLCWAKGCVAQQPMRPSESTNVFDGPPFRHHVVILERIVFGYRSVHTHGGDPLPLIGCAYIVKPTFCRAVLIGWLCGEITQYTTNWIGRVGTGM